MLLLALGNTLGAQHTASASWKATGFAGEGNGGGMLSIGFTQLVFLICRRRWVFPAAALLLSGCASVPQRVDATLDLSHSVLGSATEWESESSERAERYALPERGAPRRAPRMVVLAEGRAEEEADDRTFVGIHEVRRPGSAGRDQFASQRSRGAPMQRSYAEASYSGNDLWARLRRGFVMPDLNTELVQDREQWYAARAESVLRMAERAGRYLFHIMEEVAQRGMPAEVALLPFVESAFNPHAVSPAQAAGIWQFIPTTGSAYDLRQNIFRDDRRAVMASTRAALDYLSKLYSMFGDWHLALAAYNWGEGNVQRAINNNQRNGLPTDYLSLNMPEETRYYVPKLLALKNIVSRPDAYGVRLPRVDNQPYFAAVPIERDIDVSLAIELAGVSPDEFMKLNPQFNSPVIFASTTPHLLLPQESASRFASRLNQFRGRQVASWTAWTAPRTMSLADVARELRTSEATLRQVNTVPKAMLVNRGSTLLVPREPHVQEDVPLQVADNAVMSLSRAGSPRAQTSQRLPRRAVALNSAN